jgi:hypothetical protein
MIESSKAICLYRHFAADGSLLYVGISMCAINRLSQHEERSHWFDQIATVKNRAVPRQETGTRCRKGGNHKGKAEIQSAGGQG